MSKSSSEIFKSTDFYSTASFESLLAWKQFVTHLIHHHFFSIPCIDWAQVLQDQLQLLVVSFLICDNGSLLRPDWCRAAVLRSILDCFRASSSQLSCVSPFRTHWNCSSFDRGYFGDTTGSIRWRGLSVDPCPVCHWRWLRHWLGSDRFRCWPGHCFRTMHWRHLPSAWGGRWPARCAAAVLGIHGVPDHLRLGHCPGAPLRQPTHQVRAQIHKLVERVTFFRKENGSDFRPLAADGLQPKVCWRFYGCFMR